MSRSNNQSIIGKAFKGTLMALTNACIIWLILHRQHGQVRLDGGRRCRCGSLQVRDRSF